MKKKLGISTRLPANPKPLSNWIRELMHGIISHSKDNATRAVDHQRTLMYWHIGKRIFEEEQEGKHRADYGKFLIRYLSEQLQPEFGSVFSIRQINLYRQFYRTFENVHTLYAQLSWSQYKLL